VTRLVIKGINPEPWAIGTVQVFGRNGKISPNLKLVTYQQALREELQGTPETDLLWAKTLHCMFFRSTERGQPADATNLLKATEDALQGVLWPNDTINRKVTGEIIEQGPHVEHVGIIIEYDDYDFDPDEHSALLAEMVAAPVRAFQDQDYQPPEEDYL
jgi:hypothetical protein